MAIPPQNLDANLNWANTPAMGSEGFHGRGQQEWRYDATGVFLRASPNTPLPPPPSPPTNMVFQAPPT